MRVAIDFAGWCEIDAKDIMLQCIVTGEVKSAQEWYNLLHEKNPDFMGDMIVYDFSKVMKDADEMEYEQLDAYITIE